MENQPPAAATTGRPWLRLGSIARVGGQGQAPGTTPVPALGPASAPTRAAPPRPARVPAPRIPVVPPPAAPLQPQPQPTAPPVSSQLQPVTPSTSTNGAPVVEAQKGPNPVPPPSSPMTRVLSKSPPQPDSPKVISKPSTPTSPANTQIRQLEVIKAPPPSPYPESEPKQQGNINGIAKTIAENNSKPMTNDSQLYFKNRAHPPPSPMRKADSSGSTKKNDDDGEIKIITMAGENMGAYMEVRSHHHQSNNQKQPHFLRPDGNESKSEDGETENKKKGKVAAQGRPIKALVNSNVQSVNNSILLGSSCSQQNPGVHITFTSQRKPKHKGFLK